MKKLAIVSAFLLLFAGTGLTLGQTCGGDCNCPSGTACSQSICGANCGGSCNPQDASAKFPAYEASPCGTYCPNGNCGGLGRSNGCCGS